MAELRPAVCQAAGEQGMLGWLLRRLKVTVINQCLLSISLVLLLAVALLSPAKHSSVW